MSTRGCIGRGTHLAVEVFRARPEPDDPTAVYRKKVRLHSHLAVDVPAGGSAIREKRAEERVAQDGERSSSALHREHALGGWTLSICTPPGSSAHGRCGRRGQAPSFRSGYLCERASAAYQATWSRRQYAHANLDPIDLRSAPSFCSAHTSPCAPPPAKQDFSWRPASPPSTTTARR